MSVIDNDGTELGNVGPDGEVSDGYHTFNELYEFRMLYNAGMFGLLVLVAGMLHQTEQFNIHKSKRHNNGELCFGGGWFIVMATLPNGGQISNHYEMGDWDLFHVPEKEKADKWDGHTPQDVALRLRAYLENVGHNQYRGILKPPNDQNGTKPPKEP